MFGKWKQLYGVQLEVATPLPLTSQLCEKNIKVYGATANKLNEIKLSLSATC